MSEIYDLQASSVPSRLDYDDEMDMDLAYFQGFVSVEELFDRDPEEDVEPYEDTPLSEWDRANDKIIHEINPNSSFLSKDEWIELSAVIKRGKEVKQKLSGVDPSDYTEDQRSDIEQADKAKLRAFNSQLRLAAWFTRESMGLNKEDSYRRRSGPSMSKYSPMPISGYEGAPLDYDERFQAIAGSLMKSIEDHDPTRSAFSTYAFYGMERALITEIQNISSDFVTRVPVVTQELFRRVKRSAATADAHGLDPNLDETVYEAGTSHVGVEKAISQMAMFGSKLYIENIDQYLESAHDDSFDEPDELLSLADRVRAVNDLSMLGEFENDEVARSILADAIGALPDRGRHILVHYYGLDSQEKLNFLELGKMHGFSDVRARQIFYKALKQLREDILWKVDFGDFVPEQDGDIHSGIRPVVLDVSEDEKLQLGIPKKIKLDRTPSDKYRVKDPAKPKFVYQEDWS